MPQNFFEDEAKFFKEELRQKIRLDQLNASLSDGYEDSEIVKNKD